MPEAVEKLDPQIVNTICNEIIESSSAIQWDDIAGMFSLKYDPPAALLWSVCGTSVPSKSALLALQMFWGLLFGMGSIEFTDEQYVGLNQLS
jgi:hypothetical protein